VSDSLADLRLILTTFSSEEAARAVIRQLLEQKLIACGTLIPGAKSFYHWKGVIEESAEVLVLLKTNETKAPRCMKRLGELHPYEVPEIILLDPEAVTAPYAAWIKESLKESLSKTD
jgi:periplasmic divalent cation tolerance protein